MECLDVRMILGFRQYAGDDAPLLGDPKSLVGAEGLNVDRALHGQ